jgi:hypothetical protein
MTIDAATSTPIRTSTAVPKVTGVDRREPDQEAAEEEAATGRERDADDRADERQPPGLAQYDPQHAFLRRSKRDADRDLARALRDRDRRQAIEARLGQEVLRQRQVEEVARRFVDLAVHRRRRDADDAHAGGRESLVFAS